MGCVLRNVAKESKIAAAVASVPNPCPVLAMRKSDESGQSEGLASYWMVRLVRPDKLNQFVRRMIIEFPAHDMALIRQLMLTISPPKAIMKDGSVSPMDPYTALISALLGRYYSDNVAEACGACGDIDAMKRCSRCHEMPYCNADCQKIHWIVHRRRCPKADKGSSKGKIKEPEQGETPLQATSNDDLSTKEKSFDKLSLEA
jgi:hypothetical protein